MAVNVAARPTVDDRIRAALWFAERGFRVFSVWSTAPDGKCRCPRGAQCENPGKHPITAHGFQDATADAGRIRTLLSAGSEPNYGLVCPEGVFALDVDGEGVERLATLEQRHGPLPDTLRTATAHGEHVFLRWPTAYPRPIGHLFGFVTRWGSGRDAGYVIGPRSVHASGVAYAPVGGTFEIAVLPDNWAEATVERPITITGPVPPETVVVGGRHDWLRNRARYYRGFIDDAAVLRATLLAENARLHDPKTPEEVDRAIGDVFAKFPLDPPEVREERVERRLADDELDLLDTPASSAFPDPPDEAAFGGLCGECVGDLEPGTDASRVGLLGAFLAFAGALIPGHAYFHRNQTSSPFVALVGESAIGRKGTAMIRVMDGFSQALETVTVNRVVLDGLNSGEGLVSELDYKRQHFPQEPTVGLVFEEEYATLLAARGRDGSTLDPKMRQAFDGGPLSNRRSAERKIVAPPYWLPALIGITPVELRARLEPGALQSGSANRWLYLPVVQRDVIPANTPPMFEDEHRTAIIDAHRAAVRRPLELIVDSRVTRTLDEYADFLPTVAYGLALDLTRRLSIIAFRVALVHALVERDARVRPAHLERAIALTEYARRGLGWVFGDTFGNRDADLLFRHLVAAGRLTVRAITRGIVRDPLRRQAAIDELLRLGRAHVVTVQTGGRPRSEILPTAQRGAFVPFAGGKPFRAEGPDGGAFVTLNRVLGNRLEESPENVELSDKSVQGGVTKASQKPAKRVPEVPEGPEARREGGEVWCHYFRDHYTAHRDLQADPWCTICSPRGTP